MFCLYFSFNFLPCSLNTLLLFSQFLSRSFTTVQSIKNYLHGVKFLHRASGLDTSVFSSFQITLALRGIARRINRPPIQAVPVTPQMLLAIFPFLNLHCPLDITLWAAYLISFFLFARKSNLVASSILTFDITKQFTRSDFSLCPLGLVAKFRWSKTNQFHTHANSIPLTHIPSSPLCPVQAFVLMINTIPALSSDPAFCIPSHSGLKPLTFHTFISRFQTLLTQAGFDPTGITGHSFKRGGASFAFASGVPSELIKHQGQWKSDCYLRYLEFSMESKFLTIQLVARQISTLP